MCQRLRWLFVLPAFLFLTPVAAAASFTTSAPGLAVAATTPPPDYPGATWNPADPSNYSVADRVHDYPIDMIVIHDIEGSAPWAVQLFQTPGFGGSAHYVVDYNGSITQMVREKDIAWHAGNWDYNTRAIGIEHAGFASQNLYTTAEYDASAHLAASICSRYGVPMDRSHVIGHYQVPDPNNPGQYGGVDHHTDPGPYWNWSYYMGQASSFANALPSPPHMMTVPATTPIDGGATIAWDGRTCHLPVASYQVVVNPGNIVVNLPGTTTSTTVTGLQNGTVYTVSVTATNADGTDSNSTTFIPSPPCATPTLSAAPPSPVKPGVSVTFTASAGTCTNPTYRYWVQPAGGNWQIVRDYATSNTYTWSAGQGSYRIEVDARQQTSSVVPYDAVASMPYTLSTSCIGATIATDKPSPQAVGSTVTVQGGSSCPDTPQYRFWVGQNGLWRVAQDYGASSSFAWNSSGYAPGTYGLEVDVRVQGSTATYEAVANTTYSLSQCASAGLTTDKASPQPPGTTVTLNATSSCAGTPEYRFWVGQNGAWTVAQDYSPSSSFAWNTTGKAQGTYGLEVDVRNHGSTASYEAVANTTFTLAPALCATPTFTASPSSQAATGAHVTLTASTGGCADPRYRFWIAGPGGGWTVVQDYSPTATFTWTTTGIAGAYRLEVDVRDAASSASYDHVANMTYTLAGCTAAHLATDKASPQPQGTTVVLTGSATCPGTAEYRFWVRDTSGRWQIKQDYSSSSTYSWNTTGLPPGTYGLEVDVRDSGSTDSYETVANLTFGVQ